MSANTGGDRLCQALTACSVDAVFGLPGSQTVALHQALRRAGVRCVNASHELAASFMANGYARASGRPAVVVTGPGPGFTWALSGLAEARLDSVPVLLVTSAPATGPGRRFQLQALDQAAVAGPLVKGVLTATRPEETGPRTLEALDLTTRGEPGPVILQVASELFGAPAPELGPIKSAGKPVLNREDVAAVAERLASAERPLLYVGQGAAEAAEAVSCLAERSGALVVTTTSGRGVVPEDDPRVLVFDTRAVDPLNRLVEAADLVLALGCKFSHNGAHGFALRIPPEKLLHVDASPEVLGANYACSLAVTADVPGLLADLLARDEPSHAGSPGWPTDEQEHWRAEAADAGEWSNPAPRFSDLDPPTAEGFFAALRGVLPREACFVADSGHHQVMARRHHRVLAPRGFLVPTNFQSMGFALPAAIGAAVSGAHASVVALLGDGGLLMSGLELATAAREGLGLAVIVFVDGHYGQIRRKQLQDVGPPFATDLPRLDLEALAVATGVSYCRLDGDPGPLLKKAISGGKVTLIEVRLGESAGLRRLRARAAMRSGAHTLGLLDALRRLRRG